MRDTKFDNCEHVLDTIKEFHEGELYKIINMNAKDDFIYSMINCLAQEIKDLKKNAPVA